MVRALQTDPLMSLGVKALYREIGERQKRWFEGVSDFKKTFLPSNEGSFSRGELAYTSVSLASRSIPQL